MMTGGGWTTFVVVSLVVALLPAFVPLGRRRFPGGYWGSLVASLVGAIVGGALLGEWWWVIGGYNVIGGIIGALVIGYGAQLIAGRAEPTART